MFSILFGLMIQSLYAGEPGNVKVDDTLVVESRMNMVVYVEEPVIDNISKKISSHINNGSIVGYVSSHARLGKVKNERGIYEPVTMHTDTVEVYDITTIKYAYEECDYISDALLCAIQNDHYLVRTNISISDHEIIVRMTLYSSTALIVNTASYSSRSVIKWLKQQEINTSVTTSPTLNPRASSGTNCSGTSCSSRTTSQPQIATTTSVNKPKEEMPIRFAIPPRLLDKNIHQASMSLFVGVKLD